MWAKLISLAICVLLLCSAVYADTTFAPKDFEGNFRFRQESCTNFRRVDQDLQFTLDTSACVWYAEPVTAIAPVQCYIDGGVANFTITVRESIGGTSYIWELVTLDQSAHIYHEVYPCVDDVTVFYGKFYNLDALDAGKIDRKIRGATSMWTNDVVEVSHGLGDREYVHKYSIKSDRGTEISFDTITRENTVTRDFRWRYNPDNGCITHKYISGEGDQQQVTATEVFCPTRGDIFKQRALPISGYYSTSPQFYLGPLRDETDVPEGQRTEGWWWPACQYLSLDTNPQDAFATTEYLYESMENNTVVTYQCAERFEAPASPGTVAMPADYFPPFLLGTRQCTSSRDEDAEAVTLKFRARALEDGSFEYAVARNAQADYPNFVNEPIKTYLFPCTTEFALAGQDFAPESEIDNRMPEPSEEELIMLAQSHSVDVPCVPLYDKLSPVPEKPAGIIDKDGQDYPYLLVFPDATRVKLLINECSHDRNQAGECDRRDPRPDDTTATLPSLTITSYKRCDGLTPATFMGSFLDTHGNTENCQPYVGPETEDKFMLICNSQTAIDLQVAPFYPNFWRHFLEVHLKQRTLTLHAGADHTLKDSTYGWSTTPSGAIIVSMTPQEYDEPNKQEPSTTWREIDTFFGAIRYVPVGRQSMFANGVFAPMVARGPKTLSQGFVTRTSPERGEISLSHLILAFTVNSPFAARGVAIAAGQQVEYDDDGYKVIIVPNEAVIMTYSAVSGVFHFRTSVKSDDIFDAFATDGHFGDHIDKDKRSKTFPVEMRPQYHGPTSFEGLWQGPFTSDKTPFALGIIQNTDTENDKTRPVSRNIHEYWRTAIAQAFAELNIEVSPSGKAIWNEINTCRVITSENNPYLHFKAPSAIYNEEHVELACDYEFTADGTSSGGMGRFMCGEKVTSFRWSFPSGSAAMIQIHYITEDFKVQTAIFTRCATSAVTTEDIDASHYISNFVVPDTKNALGESLARPSTARGAIWQQLTNGESRDAPVFVRFSGVQGYLPEGSTLPLATEGAYQIRLSPLSVDPNAKLLEFLRFDTLKQDPTTGAFTAFKNDVPLEDYKSVSVLASSLGTFAGDHSAGSFSVFAYPTDPANDLFAAHGSFGPSVSVWSLDSRTLFDEAFEIPNIIKSGKFQYAPLLTEEEIKNGLTDKVLHERCGSTELGVQSSGLTSYLAMMQIPGATTQTINYFSEGFPGIGYSVEAKFNEDTEGTFRGTNYALRTDKGRLRIVSSKNFFPNTLRRTGHEDVRVEEWVPCVETATLRITLHARVDGAEVDWTKFAVQRELVERLSAKFGRKTTPVPLYNVRFIPNENGQTTLSFTIQATPLSPLVPLLVVAHDQLVQDKATIERSFAFEMNSAGAKAPSNRPNFNTGGKSSGTSAGTVVGIIIAIIAAAAIGFFGYRYWKRKQNEKRLRAELMIQESNYQVLG